jgi:4-diphosphocytidyl-2-C-methyl-D-erythritol kinase
MRSYSLIAPAKINLYLEILGDRPDGYHELVMILQSIDLADHIELHPNGTDRIRLHCSHSQVPLDESNLAYRAAKLMQKQFPKVAANYGGFDITIDKRIPVAAGLAGGSSNAAAVLVGLDLMWDLGLTQPELQTLAAQLGSDVPFCIAGGTAIATGRGEQLDPLEDLDTLWVVLAKYESLAVSTAWAYTTYRQYFGHQYISDHEKIKSRALRIHAGSLVHAITQKEGRFIGKFLHNDLEKVVLQAFSPVAQLKQTLKKAGGLGTMMSGSGPTVFTLCESKQEAQRIQQQVTETLRDPDLKSWIAKLSCSGIQVTAGGRKQEI